MILVKAREALLESDGGGVIVSGSPWSVWQTLQDARRHGEGSVVLFRGRDRFELDLSTDWKIKEWTDRG